MKKMLRFEMHARTEVVEVPGDSPVGALYSDRGRKVGEIVSQMEASDLPESGAVRSLPVGLHPPEACVGTVSAACRLSVHCARRKRQVAFIRI